MIEYHKQYVYQVGYNGQTSNWYNVQSLYRLYNVESIILKKCMYCNKTKQHLSDATLTSFYLMES